MTPVLRLRNASAGFGDRTLWGGLDLDVEPGEFVAVLGANGTGKTTLLRTILGLQPLRAGSLEVNGRPTRRGSNAIGYVPQERSIVAGPFTLAREFVGFGLDGNRWGLPLPSRSRRTRIREALAEAGAEPFADRPLSALSGGEVQRVRIAQALATDPALLLCDEPLVSLDLRRQQEVSAVIDERRRTHDTAVLFVTHEINPVLPYVNRVLYLAHGRFRLGTVDEVMTTESLSELYDAPVDVIRTRGRILVAGLSDTFAASHEHDSHREHDPDHDPRLRGEAGHQAEDEPSADGGDEPVEKRVGAGTGVSA